LLYAATALAIGCGGPDRPAGDPSRGSGGNGSPDLVPAVPNPTPTPPAPTPGGPDVTPLGDLTPDVPAPVRDLRGPFIAASMPLDRTIVFEAANGGTSGAGRPGTGSGGKKWGAGGLHH